jgi:hypothetical protein
MTANDAWIIHKRIDNEINALEVAPQEYINFQLKDPRKLQIYQSIVDSGVDVKKFFLANCTLNKEFWIDYYKFNPERCLTLYYSWDEFLRSKRPAYFRRVMEELKKGIRLNLDDRDGFLELVQVHDPLLFSALYPEDLELLLSLDGDWVKFHIPPYQNAMEYIRKVIRGHLILKEMKSYDKLRAGVLKIIDK